jgi:hypothetical protein
MSFGGICQTGTVTQEFSYTNIDKACLFISFPEYRMEVLRKWVELLKNPGVIRDSRKQLGFGYVGTETDMAF